jgi:uncharacterized protein (TIGR02453 family)
MKIQKETLRFLGDLKRNNNREWFNGHKDAYLSANENFIAFVQSLIDEVAKFDDAVAGLDAKQCVFRIYRDTRFSKIKLPYKTHFAATLMGKGTGCAVAGYYVHMEPGESFLAGGVHMTEPKNLNAIRDKISADGKQFLRIIGNESFKNNFTILGEKLQRVPAGFQKDDPMGEFLKYKELMVRHSVDDKSILSDGFIAYCSRIFKAMVPFNSFVNQAVGGPKSG